MATYLVVRSVYQDGFSSKFETAQSDKDILINVIKELDIEIDNPEEVSLKELRKVVSQNNGDGWDFIILIVNMDTREKVFEYV